MIFLSKTDSNFMLRTSTLVESYRYFFVKLNGALFEMYHMSFLIHGII